MKQIRWGIIGCGNVTEVKSGPAFQQIEGSSIVAVMRRDALKAADYAKRHKIAKWYSKADDLINDSEVNAIYIATPPDTHAFYTIKALEAGKPTHVQKQLIQQVVNSLQEKSECLSTAKSAIETNRIMEEIVYRPKN